jgi:hypothetical protein
MAKTRYMQEMLRSVERDENRETRWPVSSAGTLEYAEDYDAETERIEHYSDEEMRADNADA